jgi:hypothetical protein
MAGEPRTYDEALEGQKRIILREYPGVFRELQDAVALYRDAPVNSGQRCDGLNAIIKAAIRLVDASLPTADEVRGILADDATRAAILAAQPLCASCGHNKVHHFGAVDGKAPALDDHRCWVWKCRCKGWRP